MILDKIVFYSAGFSYAVFLSQGNSNVGHVLDMAVSSKKSKGNKDGDKKQAKKIEEEVVRTEERKEEPVPEVDVSPPIVEEQLIDSYDSPPAPEPVYEEPVLTQLIVSRFVNNRKLYSFAVL